MASNNGDNSNVFRFEEDTQRYEPVTQGVFEDVALDSERQIAPRQTQPNRDKNVLPAGALHQC